MQKEQNLSSTWTTVAEIELIYKTKIKASARPKINTSSDAYRILESVWCADKMDMLEEFKVLYLNRANAVLGVYQASSGGITGTIADPRLIITAALKANAVGIILAHNHPSGNLTPSRADEALTNKIKEAGSFLDIKILDHIIISSEGYLSFADEGLI